MFKELKPAILIFVVMTVLTGVLYPLFVTAVAQGLFKWQADGSIIQVDGKPVGSELIGQTFDEPRYFWGRLSATAPAYNAAASSGSNYGPLNPALKDAVAARIQALKAADPSNGGLVPVDLVTASGSGLDPHISQAAAYYQAARVARARGISEEQARELIRKNSRSRFLGFLGEPVVNVLMLNLSLDHGIGYSLEARKLRWHDYLPAFLKWGNLK